MLSWTQTGKQNLIYDIDGFQNKKTSNVLMFYSVAPPPLPDMRGCGPSELIGGSAMEREDLSMADCLSVAAYAGIINHVIK